MANDKDIKIGIKTEADTSGAEEAEKAIKEVGEAAAKAGSPGAGDPAAAAAERDLAAATREGAEAMRESTDAGDDMADVFARLDALKARATAATDELAEATGGLSKEEREAAAQAELMAAKVEQIEYQSRKLVAVELAKGLSEIGQQFRGISPEIDQAITGTGNFLNILASTGDVSKATSALVIGEIGNMITALREADAYNAETVRRQVDGLDKIKRGREAVVAQIRSENMSAFFDQETQAIDRQIAAISRKQRVVDAQREAEAATQQARAAVGAANARPGQTLPSALDNEVTQKFSAVSDTIKKLDDSVANAKETLQLERDKLTAAYQQADLSASREGEGGENALKDAAAVEQAKARVADLEEEVASIEQAAAFQKQTIIQQAVTTFTGLGETAEEVNTNLAKGLQDEIKKIEATGAELSPQLRQAKTDLFRVLADNMITPDEAGSIATIFQQAKSSQEARDNAFISAVQDMALRAQASEKRITDILKQLNERGATGG